MFLLVALQGCHANHGVSQEPEVNNKEDGYSCTDQAGNRSDSLAFNIDYDATPPVFTRLRLAALDRRDAARVGGEQQSKDAKSSAKAADLEARVAEIGVNQTAARRTETLVADLGAIKPQPRRAA